MSATPPTAIHARDADSAKEPSIQWLPPVLISAAGVLTLQDLPPSVVRETACRDELVAPTVTAHAAEALTGHSARNV